MPCWLILLCFDGEPWLGTDVKIFHLGKFSLSLVSIQRGPFCSLIALGICAAAASPLPQQHGFSKPRVLPQLL